VRYGGERIVIERHGRPVAGLVGIEDLERLEGLSASERSVEARYKESLERAGVEVRWTEGRSREGARRRRARTSGSPVSEQIVSERR
jgi:antitoxin (DNA-binding transcriptional repressor) of toxin-antitoxin stability system